MEYSSILMYWNMVGISSLSKIHGHRGSSRHLGINCLYVCLASIYHGHQFWTFSWIHNCTSPNYSCVHVWINYWRLVWLCSTFRNSGIQNVELKYRGESSKNETWGLEIKKDPSMLLKVAVLFDHKSLNSTHVHTRWSTQKYFPILWSTPKLIPYFYAMIAHGKSDKQYALLHWLLQP